MTKFYWWLNGFGVGGMAVALYWSLMLAFERWRARRQNALVQNGLRSVNDDRLASSERWGFNFRPPQPWPSPSAKADDVLFLDIHRMKAVVNGIDMADIVPAPGETGPGMMARPHWPFDDPDPRIASGSKINLEDGKVELLSVDKSTRHDCSAPGAGGTAECTCNGVCRCHNEIINDERLK